MHAKQTDDHLGVVIPLDEVVALSLWIADVEETRIGLEGCPYVAPVDK